ncbi:capsule assembly Wzi family protein [Coprobacter tertius]|uniref:Capsule assembly Wzi family protein n=1 Tax=Coprobacter tertius TaxID=2944915 RepID=A0ABT1MNC5_9BACT|nr:capsule assembly Wzi family protein [Coprobacter tertius]MCP9612786.1 capsule assembly Wzi family protein [Coprobacter tertius]
MKFRGLYLLFVFLYLSFFTYAQFTKGLNYSVETGINFSGGEYTPFWLVSNKQGLSSVIKNNGYIRAGLFRQFEKNKDFSYAMGIDLAGAYNFTSAFIVQQAYVDLKYKVLNLSIGSKERNGELKNPFLSTGGLTFSGNARPIPQVRLEFPDYVAFPWTHEWFFIKGHVAYGLFTDDNWQKDFTGNSHYKYTEHVLYHSKALYIKIGNEKKAPLVFEGGLEMAAQFGGKSYTWNKNRYQVTKMYSGFTDFFKVFIPAGGGSSVPMGEQTNILGNHLGSWNFSLSYKFDNWKVRAYYEHFFEDHSMMFFEYAWKDCLTGVEITFPKNRVINNFVYEYLGSRDQSGPIYHDATPIIPDQVSALDNYYNHGIYTGWQHWGMGIGNALLTSPIYNKNGNIYFSNNRIKAHHIGICGTPFSGIDYRLLVTRSRNWGTYSIPFKEIRKNTSFLLELSYLPRNLTSWKFTASFAFDRGDLMGNNTGGMITICKTGLFTK